jgi:hypothetical protein
MKMAKNGSRTICLAERSYQRLQMKQAVFNLIIGPIDWIQLAEIQEGCIAKHATELRDHQAIPVDFFKVHSQTSLNVRSHGQFKG